jgi:membrane protein
MAWTTSERVMRLRIRSAAIDLVVETLDGWRRHLVGRNVAVLTYYGFLSVFPLFMVGTTILGLVLQNNEQLREEILDTAVAQIPVIGSEIQRQAGELSGSVTTVVIGLVIALWAATRAFVGVQIAFDDAWDVAIDRRDNLAVRRVKALLGLVIIGSSLVAATALSGLVSVGNLPWGGRLLTLLGTIAINIGVLAAMFRFLTAAEVSWSQAVPGAVFGGLGFTVLQVAGATIVQRFLANAADTTGVFATVFALMAWLNLHALLSLTGAELNAAICRRRRARDEAGRWLRSGLGHADLHQLP